MTNTDDDLMNESRHTRALWTDGPAARAADCACACLSSTPVSSSAFSLVEVEVGTNVSSVVAHPAKILAHWFTLHTLPARSRSVGGLIGTYTGPNQALMPPPTSHPAHSPAALRLRRRPAPQPQARL